MSAEDEEHPEELDQEQDSEEQDSEDDQEVEDEQDAEDAEGAEPEDASERRMPKKRAKKSGAKKSGSKRKKKPSQKAKRAKSKAKGADADDAPEEKDTPRRKPKRSAEREAEASGERWLCVHCGHRFVEKDPARCPSCMRKNGLEVLEDATTAEGRPWLMPAVLVGLVVIAGGAYAMWSSETPDAVEGDAPLEPLSFSALRGHLRQHNADGEHASLFETGEAVEALAEHASGGSDVAKAEALTTHIRSRAEAGAFSRWLLETPRESPIHDAEWAAAQLAEEPEEPANLYPLEVAAAAVAALREADVPAMVAEIWEFPGDRVPPDPSGHMGYYGVAVYEGEVGEGDPRIFDPYAGHATEPESGSYRVLTDVQAVAARLNTSALHQLVHENDSVRAMEQVRRALRIDRRAPYIRSVQAVVFITNGGTPQGIEELQAAAQIRPDGPRRNNVAGVFLATQDVDQAGREVAAALEQFPDFAAAHAWLAAIHMAQGESEEARVELARADQLEPRLQVLPLLWAQYHLSNGDSETAARFAREAIARRPHHWQTRLQAAQIFRAAGAYDEMRRQAHQVVELVGADQREVIREHILRVLGPTALEEVDDEDLALGDDDLGDLDDLGLGGDEGGFQLGSSLLDGEADTEGGGGPSLLDEELGGGAAGLMLGGGGGGFQLGGGGSGLRLNLND